ASRERVGSVHCHRSRKTHVSIGTHQRKLHLVLAQHMTLPDLGAEARRSAMQRVAIVVGGYTIRLARQSERALGNAIAVASHDRPEICLRIASILRKVVKSEDNVRPFPPPVRRLYAHDARAILRQLHLQRRARQRVERYFFARWCLSP